ncbi:MAG: type 4a pilus biogenesis protein PilO [Pyrinomonadaceae bacterium]|nr:type 4a pilus biogenesis protein PilO [Pyrinomonadaceae bacterium]
MMKLKDLQAKPWYYQLAVFSVGGLLVCAAFYYFITSNTRVETSVLDEQITKLQQDNAAAQVASQRINEFRAAYTRSQAEYEDLKALLPEQRELTSVLQGLQDRAQGRLSVRRFSPKEDVQQDFYFGKPIEVAVSGSYNNVGAFFAQMAAFQRIVSISDFQIRQATQQGTGQTIDTQFLLTAYYVPTESLQPAAPPGTAATAKPITPPITPAPAKN